MFKVHPQLPSPTSSPSPSSSGSCSCTSSTREVFTIWMKSLILGGNGCTVFNSKGHVVYRVDNYNSKCCDQVFLMDSHGHILLTIQRKKFKLLAQWEGYTTCEEELKERRLKPWFRVRKTLGFFKDEHKACEVALNPGHGKLVSAFNIERKRSASFCKIVDKSGTVLAEMKRKQSEGGVILGDDVLTMVMEPNVDPSLVMGMLVSYCLIDSKM